ncbi:MAG: ATP-binding protein [Desulfobulbaceae bacterium]|nr:ATP-binding protein [Desulfobulbaceae bacterium]
MVFVGRKRELKALECAYQSPNSTFIPVYGRRRVGKSELIKHFIQDKQALYFLGKQAPARLQLKEFLRNGASALNQPLLEQASVADWQKAISLILEQVPAGEKLILVMDEFQWTAEACPELPSVLQSFIDDDWGGRSKMFLILCGSYMGFMEKKVLGEKSPLFGRRSGQILLKPFSYLEAGEFHPGWSMTDKAKVFSICGGIPYYLKFFSRSDSVDINIRKNFLNEFSALAREPEFLLREELKELKKYFGILTALSTGAVTNREMAKITGIEEKTLFYYLHNLKELGYIARHYPLTGAKQNPKQVRYKLQDPLLRFWFRFIYPNGSAIYQMEEKNAFMNLIKPHLESYFGHGFETLCRDAISRLYQKEELTCSYEIGEYWAKDVQIDIVGYRRDGVVDICECKWGKIPSMPQLLKELKSKIACYPNKENKTINGRLFLRSRLKLPINSNIQAYSLDDLYSLT